MSGSVPSAATVVLVRDGFEGVETYLMRRVATMAFAPRMHVFPGGRLDDVDRAARVSIIGGDVHELARRASADPDELHALYSCAVRETREEVGLELGTVTCDGAVQVDALAMPIVDHWVTPEGETRRYDVRFFAAMIVGDDARLTTTEADEGGWLRPALALDSFAAGDLPMLPPTESVLRWLSDFSTAADVIAAGSTRAVVPLLPLRVVDDAGSSRWILVNDRTREVISDPHAAPHTRESDGLPMESA